MSVVQLQRGEAPTLGGDPLDLFVGGVGDVARDQVVDVRVVGPFADRGDLRAAGRDVGEFVRPHGQSGVGEGGLVDVLDHPADAVAAVGEHDQVAGAVLEWGSHRVSLADAGEPVRPFQSVAVTVTDVSK